MTAKLSLIYSKALSEELRIIKTGHKQVLQEV